MNLNLQQFASSVQKEDITLGVGWLYIAEYSGSIPENSVIETEDNQIGHLSGGVSLEYTCERTDLEDDLGAVVDSRITKESAIMKAGALSWGQETLAKLSETSTVVEDITNNIITVWIGGKANANGKEYLVHFVHQLKDGRKIRLTIKAVPNSGFTLGFNKEDGTVIDMEFKALAMDKSVTDGKEGRLIRYQKETALPTM
nr:hypothetical protein [uncultured Cellulosilyticum sp.]